MNLVIVESPSKSKKAWRCNKKRPPGFFYCSTGRSRPGSFWFAGSRIRDRCRTPHWVFRPQVWFLLRSWVFTFIYNVCSPSRFIFRGLARTMGWNLSNLGLLLLYDKNFLCVFYCIVGAGFIAAYTHWSIDGFCVEIISPPFTGFSRYYGIAWKSFAYILRGRCLEGDLPFAA